MAQASIAQAALILSTDATKLYSGMSQAGGRMQSWAKSTSSQTSAQLGGIFGSFGGMAVTKLGAIGAAAAAAFVAGFSISKIADKLDEIRGMGATSKALGLSPEKGSGLFGLLGANQTAGVNNTKENLESIVQMAGRIKDAMAGADGEAKELFRGLSIKPQDLAGKDVAEQFFLMHDAISRLSDPLEKNRKLALMFGTDGQKLLLPVLNKTTAELREQSKQFEVSARDQMIANSASEAWRNGMVALGMASTQVAIAFAPIVEILGNTLATSAKSFGVLVVEWKDSLFPVLHGLALGFAGIFDTIKAGLGTIKVFGGVLTNAAGAITSIFAKQTGIDMQLKGRAAVDDGLAGITQWGSSVKWVDDLFSKMLNKRLQGEALIGKEQAKQIRTLETVMGLQVGINSVKSGQKGSFEAAEIEARWRSPSTGKVRDDDAKRTADNTAKALPLLNKIAGFKNGEIQFEVR